MKNRLLVAAFAAALLAAGTASAQAADTTARPAPTPDSTRTKPAPSHRARPARSSEISRDEIMSVHVADAYQLIQRLRPGWLNRVPNNPGTITMSEPLVYYNGNRVGASSWLREYSPEQLTSIRFYSPVEAQARFGPDASGGVVAMIGM